jgi:hypothetical protein
MCPIRKSAGTKAAPVEVSRGYLQFLWTNAGIIRRVRSRITNRPQIQRYAVGNTDSVLQSTTKQRDTASPLQT